MKNARKLLCLAAAAALLLPALALAGGRLYLVAPNPPFWPDAAFPVPFNINPASAVGQIDGVDPQQQFIDATVAAFQTWTDVPTSRITFARGPDSADLIDATPGDGVNLMVFNSTAIVQGIPIPLPPGALAVTNTFFDFNTGEISGGAITFNTDPIPGHPNPDFSTSGAPGSIDVEAIMLHEAGHFQGLSHSNVRNDAGGDLVGGPSNAAVMFPFISPDVLDGRVPDADDIAWQGVIYPDASYATTFGAIQGDVPLGSTLGGCTPPSGAQGAHVVARDVTDLVGGEPRMIVGTYSYKEDGPLGRYTIPGLLPGTYQVWIEPLDGTPVAALQVNSRLQFTSLLAFPEDWYSGAAESGTEAAPNNPATAANVTVTAGNTTTGIDVIVENSVAAPVCGALTAWVEGLSPRGRALSAAASQLVFLTPFAFVIGWRTLRRRKARAK